MKSRQWHCTLNTTSPPSLSWLVNVCMLRFVGALLRSHNVIACCRRADSLFLFRFREPQKKDAINGLGARFPGVGGNKLSAQELLFRSVYHALEKVHITTVHSPGSLPCRAEVLNAEPKDAGENVVNCWPIGRLGEDRRGLGV